MGLNSFFLERALNFGVLFSNGSSSEFNPVEDRRIKPEPTTVCLFHVVTSMVLLDLGQIYVPLNVA